MACVSWCEFAGDFPDKDLESNILQWEITLGTLSNWFRNEILGIMSGETPTIPQQLYIKMHSTESDELAAGTELSGGNYFKTPVTFERVSQVQLRNATTVNSQLSTDEWLDVTSFTLFDEQDNYYAYGNLRAPLSIIAGKGVQWPAGNITIGIGTDFNDGFSNWFINEVLEILLLNTPTTPTQMQIAANSTIGFGDRPGVEVTGNGYARTNVTFTRVLDTLRANATQVVSVAATGTWSVLSYSLHDSDDNYYGFSNLVAADTIPSGESIIWPIDQISVSLGNVSASSTADPVIGFTAETGPSFTKPKFTPDPPTIGGDPILVEWTKRQLDRVEDLWPKSLERRVAALEGALPYARGTWPILDVSKFLALTEIGVFTACDYDSLDFTASPTGSEVPTRSSTLPRAIDISSDGLRVLLGNTQAFDGFWIFEKSGSTWSQLDEVEDSDITTSYNTNNFGSAVAFNEGNNVAVIGANASTEYAPGSGAAFVLSGTPTSGFSFSAIIAPPTVVVNARFGTSAYISRDGSVLAISQPLGSTQYVAIYDWSGSSWTYRNSVTDPDAPSAADVGFGNQVYLNDDGTILIVGDSDHGTGSTGRITIWDDVSGTFTIRQTIDPPNLSLIGVSGDLLGEWGRGIALSSNEENLFINTAWRPVSGSGVDQPNIFVYAKNPSTGDYEFCIHKYFTRPANVNSIQSGTRSLFTTNLQKVFFPVQWTGSLYPNFIEADFS